MTKEEAIKKLDEINIESKELKEFIENYDKKHRIVKFGNFDWYVIEKDDETMKLLMKECLSKEMIKKYFTNENMIDDDYDVRFSYDIKNPLWRDSYIRYVLNSAFLNEFDIDKLEVMKTTVECDDVQAATNDYVRLLTKEEVKKIEKDILKVNREFEYWTLSPYYFSGSNALGFNVSSSGGLSNSNVTYAYAVRPVVCVKK